MPNGNKEIITTPKSTITAIEQAYEWLEDGGVISILCYLGHEGGNDEHIAVKHLIENKKWICIKEVGSKKNESPILYLIIKNQRMNQVQILFIIHSIKSKTEKFEKFFLVFLKICSFQ